MWKKLRWCPPNTSGDREPRRNDRKWSEKTSAGKDRFARGIVGPQCCSCMHAVLSAGKPAVPKAESTVIFLLSMLAAIDEESTTNKDIHSLECLLIRSRQQSHSGPAAHC